MPLDAILRERADPGRSLAELPGWKLEDAKARFSEVVRRARTEGPQRVTCRGQEAVVVIATEQLARLLAPRRTGADLIRFLQATGLGDLEIVRQDDRGRDIEI